MDSDIHNRRWIHIAMIATAFVFLGAACSRKETPPTPPAASAPQPVADAGTTTSTATMPTEWAEYRNAEFGVVIPYPKGWYVEESAEGLIVDVHRSAPPAFSDAPSEYWAESAPSRAAALGRFSVIRETSETTRFGVPLLKVAYPYDAADPDERPMIAYIRETPGRTYIIGGPVESVVLEAAIDRFVEVTR